MLGKFEKNNAQDIVDSNITDFKNTLAALDNREAPDGNRLRYEFCHILGELIDTDEIELDKFEIELDQFYDKNTLKLKTELKSALLKDQLSNDLCLQYIWYALRFGNIPESDDFGKKLRQLKQELLLIRYDALKEQYNQISDINDDQFNELCTKNNLTNEEIKQLVLYSIKEKEGSVTLSLNIVKQEQAEYLCNLYSISFTKLGEIERETYKKLGEKGAIIDLKII